MPLRILAPSIVDPRTHRGGTGAVMRGLEAALARPPLAAEIEYLVPHRSRRFHRLRQALSLGRSLFSSDPSKALFLRTRALRDAVARSLATGRFDLVLLVGSDLLWLLRELPDRPPALLLALNLEHELYLSQIRNVAAPGFLRKVLARDHRKLRDFEERWSAAADGVLFLSTEELERFAAARDRPPSFHVPPLFAYPPYARPDRQPSSQPLRLGFLGNFEWWPNRIGLRWYLTEVAPHLRGRVSLEVFGEGGEAVVGRAPGARAHGFVPDLERIWRECDLMICPIAHGAGVNVKLAEAVYNGMPVLARPFAVRGLPGMQAECVVTRDRAEEWIEFLSGDEARRLARAQPTASLVDVFRADRQASRIQPFVSRVVSQPPLEVD